MDTFNGIEPSASSQQTQRTQTWRLNSFSYGNGYEARSPDGPNWQIDTGQLTWDYLNQSEFTSLMAWITSVPPYTTWKGDGTVLSASNTYWITKDGYQITYYPGDVYGMQLNVEQVF